MARLLASHSTRHKEVLTALVKAMREVWGAAVEQEPKNHLDYSNDYRPDLAGRNLGGGGCTLVGDTKIGDPGSSNPKDVERRGAYVGFGNTKPGFHADVFGLAQRGEKGDGNFKPATGGGYVAPQKADYSHALSEGHEVLCLLFETYGGFSASVIRLLARAADVNKNKLSHSQYLGEATWSTRNWTSMQVQRISLALHRSVAWEIARSSGTAWRTT